MNTNAVMKVRLAGIYPCMAGRMEKRRNARELPDRNPCGACALTTWFHFFAGILSSTVLTGNSRPTESRHKTCRDPAGDRIFSISSSTIRPFSEHMGMR
jgi:hypothetical protein